MGEGVGKLEIMSDVFVVGFINYISGWGNGELHWLRIVWGMVYFEQAHYSGRLENGVEFDSSYKRGKPLTFRVGVGEVRSSVGSVYRWNAWYQ